MYIEEVIIDGFKSYATRTVVSGFDPCFNAITGLNGSGKSNILDSICFVLGISNLSHVRVGNLQELVYKQGQAGVTKATATINFNNADKKSSPVGYEHFDRISVTRQVVIGGKNKYLINGHAVQASQVQNLFHSVQLNVNNPHFLIMQGRITKVLNMKPHEILGMIEEAAGTRMFENKKQAALKTIEKKAAKMAEIQKVLVNEITPTLERLRKERKHYLQWSKNNAEIEKLQRLCVAHQYTQYHEEVSRSAEELLGMETERDRLKQTVQSLKAAVQERGAEAAKLHDLREKEFGKALEKAKSKEESLSKELVKMNTHWKNKKSTLDKEEKALEAMQQQVGDAHGALNEKVKELQACESSVSAAQAVLVEKDKVLQEMDHAYQAMCAGTTEGGDREDAATLTDQIASSSQAAHAAEGEAERLGLRITHLEKAIVEAKKELKKSEKEGAKIQKDRETLKSAVADLRGKLQALGSEEAAADQLRAQLQDAEPRRDALRDQIETLAAQVEGRLAFEYRDPEKGFDRSRVKGTVARLVNLKDPAAATAIEVVAGGKLYQVVTDTEQTGKLLLQKGGLKRRVTIIPLNKISRHVVEAGRLKKATQLAERQGGTARLALELVGYDSEVRAAMEHVFGSTLVCDTLDVAKSLTFNKEIGRRTVTLAGDSFDPSGTLTGGSKPIGNSILGKLQELKGATAELSSLEARVKELESALAKQGSADKERGKLTAALEMKEYELRLLEERVSQSVHGMYATQVEKQESELAESKAAVAAAKAKAVEAAARHKTLQQQEAGLRKKREEKLKGLENDLKKAKKAQEAAATEVNTAEHRRKKLELEVKELEGEDSSVAAQLTASREGLSKLTSEVEAMDTELKGKREAYETAKHTLAEAKQQVAVCDKQIHKLEAENTKAEKEISASEIESKKLENKIGRFQKDKTAVRRALSALLEKHPWVETEKQFFGRPHTDYDFEARKPAKAHHLLGKLQDEQATLAKNINKKVMAMIEKVEAEYEELGKKLQVIDNDKIKMMSVIEELEVKKNEALQTTWVKVNRDFGSIFSTLLPGTNAKLDPVEEGSVLEGLEVKVAFGSVWKETLTELSGGQRSLLALSLILSLLLFKPAPMYILDEVDAALDLSHTQNIGAMLRTHFSHSQFIVVSLKEGMFNNANVIFRTRFVDGVSTVTRTLGNGPALKSKQAQLNKATSVSALSGSKAVSKGIGNVGEEGAEKKRSKKGGGTEKSARGQEKLMLAEC
jgi:structural maintenance of chromosome 2